MIIHILLFWQQVFLHQFDHGWSALSRHTTKSIFLPSDGRCHGRRWTAITGPRFGDDYVSAVKLPGKCHTANTGRHACGQHNRPNSSGRKELFSSFSALFLWLSCFVFLNKTMKIIIFPCSGFFQVDSMVPGSGIGYRVVLASSIISVVVSPQRQERGWEFFSKL